MAVYKRKNSPFYFVAFEHKGRRYRQSAKTKSRRLAEQFEAQLRQQVYENVDLGRQQHEPMRFEDAVKRYVGTHLKTKARLEESEASQAYMLAKLIRLVGANTVLDEISTAVVADIKERIFDSGRKKPATANQYLAALRAILRMAHFEWSRLRELPRFKLFPLQNERTRWLRIEEERRLLSACEGTPHMHQLVVFLLDTGARVGEACRLTWNNVELPKRGRGVVRLFSTKTQKWRSVPMTTRLDTMLRCLHDERPTDQDRVFLVRTSGTQWRGTVPQAKPFTHPHGAWKTAVKAADLHDVRMHDLRHTFASKLVQQNVPMRAVSELLGHTTLKMTMRYAHLSTETLKHAVAKLDGVTP